MKTHRSARSLQLGLFSLAVLTGCAPAGATSAPAAAAEEFHRAMADTDTSAACALLLPKIREETAKSGDAGTCEGQLEKAEVPEPGRVRQIEQYGQDAFVEFESDTVFLTVSEGGWKVTAAGCTANGEAPYSCEIGGK